MLLVSVAVSVVSSVLSVRQETDWEEGLQNNLFYDAWVQSLNKSLALDS